jgi:hypothetical protein
MHPLLEKYVWHYFLFDYSNAVSLLFVNREALVRGAPL